MQDTRRVMCWIFAATCLLHLMVSLRGVRYAMQQWHSPPVLRSALIAIFFSAVVSIISGAAYWSVWRNKPSGRGWAIAASIMSILVYIRSSILSSRPVWDRHVGALFIGVVGLVIFLYPDAHSRFRQGPE
jgi:hypothetical protein